MNDGWHLTDADSLCGIGIAQVDKIQGGGKKKNFFPTPRTPSGNPVVVAVIDGGFDVSHPDLRDRVWTNPGEIPANGCHRRPAHRGHTPLDGPSQGAVDNGAWVINMSFGKYLSPHAREVARAIRYAARRDVLGEHFEFVGEPEFVYGKGKLTVPVQLKFLKKEEGKDKIVLKVDPSAVQYAAGDPGECTITIVGSDYFKIEGTWYVYQQPTGKEAMKGYRYFSDDAFTGFPAATEADTFTFDTEKNVLTTSLQSDLKNFFGETCNRVPADKECSVRDISDRTIEYQLLLIDPDNCNRDFSATSTGADKNAYIGIRLVKEQDTNEDTLELYLLDDQPTSFLAFLTAYYMDNDTRPVATTSSVYRLFYPKKQK
ncbi:hypothetical protein [Alistipes sp. An54]|uniref:hypothetical protein n=1 Tax=Alistipes sp. An54 TaxID=1965645 RepID=UPI001178936A|nr:hypothetical protein [Alistipes sp. An54]